MLEFIQFKWKVGSLQKFQLPNIEYPVPIDQLSTILEAGGDITFDYQLYWLQEYSEGIINDGWMELEHAMKRLTELIAPDDQHSTATAQGDNWFLEFRPLDLGACTITIQRGEHVLAALQPRSDGTLCCAIYHMLDAKSLRYLLGLSLNPNDDGMVCMRPNNWEFALDQAAPSVAKCYADMRGESYLSLWDQGLGVSSDGSTVEEYAGQRDVASLGTNLAATQLGVYFELSSE